MADTACLSTSRFSALYKQMFATSPIEDVIGARIQKALWMLGNGALSIKEISQEVGFDDPAYFSRLFKDRVGVSPNRYQFRGKREQDS